MDLSSNYGLCGTYGRSSGQIFQFDELPRLVYECKLVRRRRFLSGAVLQLAYELQFLHPKRENH
jgi:hypothetical protein